MFTETCSATETDNGWGVSLKRPVLASFLYGEFLLHIPRWLHFYAGSFSHTSHADFVFMRGVSLTHPMLTLFLCGEFLLHIPCCLHFYAESFSYTSYAVLIFMLGVSRTHPMLAFCCCFCFVFYLGKFSYTSHGGFFFYQGSCCYTSRAGFIFVWGVSLTYSLLASFLSGEFLLRIPC